MNCCTQYFIWKNYAYLFNILIKIKLYAQNVQPKIHLDVAIREGVQDAGSNSPKAE